MDSFSQLAGGQVYKTIVTSSIQAPLAPILGDLHDREKEIILESLCVSLPVSVSLSISLSFFPPIFLQPPFQPTFWVQWLGEKFLIGCDPGVLNCTGLSLYIKNDQNVLLFT